MDFGFGTNQNSPAPRKRRHMVHLLPHRELQAPSRLKVRGFRTVLPRRRKAALHARRLITVSVRILPDCLFVTVGLQRDRCRSVKGTISLTSLVMGEEYPIPVPVPGGRGLSSRCSAKRHLAMWQCTQLGCSALLIGRECPHGRYGRGCYCGFSAALSCPELAMRHRPPRWHNRAGVS